MKEQLLSKEQATVLITIANQQAQAHKAAQEADEAMKSQVELLKAFHKLTGEVDFEQRTGEIWMIEKPQAVEEEHDETNH